MSEEMEFLFCKIMAIGSLLNARRVQKRLRAARREPWLVLGPTMNVILY
jgi:hypothetical protein